MEDLPPWSRGRAKPPREQERVQQPEPEEPQHEVVAALIHCIPVTPLLFFSAGSIALSFKKISFLLQLSILGFFPPKARLSVSLQASSGLCAAGREQALGLKTPDELRQVWVSPPRGLVWL